MIPEPSKRPFGHPVPADALAFFVHPYQRHIFHTAFRHPFDGTVIAASAVALRCRAGRGIDPAEYPAPHPDALRRIDALPWDRFPHAATQPKAWRCLDDHRGTIYGDPLLPVHVRTTSGIQIDRVTKNVRICGAPIVPLSILQLLARLPRVELYTADCSLTGPVLFRFSGGEGIIPHYGLERGARFELLKPRDTSHDLDPSKF
jgi:hypothetical protein